MTAIDALPVLSEAIRQVRFDCKMSQFQFATSIGVEQTRVSCFENEKYQPNLVTLARIGELAKPGSPAKAAIVAELRFRLEGISMLQVVA